jgi:hypothetical protein
MSEQPRIDYRSRPGISPEEEVETLAGVYHFMLERLAQKESDGENRLKLEGGAHAALSEELNDELLVIE